MNAHGFRSMTVTLLLLGASLAIMAYCAARQPDPKARTEVRPTLAVSR